MIDIQSCANWASLIGFPLAIIGLILSYLSFRSQIKKDRRKIETIIDSINLHNQYQHQGQQYKDCSFVNYYGKDYNPDKVRQDYSQDLDKVGNDAE